MRFTIIRDPVERVKSAFYYRCHNPNMDCYHVRESYCQLRKKSSGECGEGVEGPKGKVWTFDEYLELPEYHNIFTRMFGGAPNGIFPYTADSPVTEEVSKM